MSSSGLKQIYTLIVIGACLTSNNAGAINYFDGSLYADPADLAQFSDDWVMKGGLLSIGTTSGAGTLSVDNARISMEGSHTDILKVGSSGYTGFLRIINGGQVTGVESLYTDTGGSKILVEGEGSRLDAGSIDLRGSLMQITRGAHVFADTFMSGGLSGGVYPRLEIAGAGSALNVNNDLMFSGGWSPYLRILDGGRVGVGQALTVGVKDALTVTGLEVAGQGSVLTSDSIHAYRAAASVRDGGRVGSTNALLDSSRLVVSGEGSQWQNVGKTTLSDLSLLQLRQGGYFSTGELELNNSSLIFGGEKDSSAMVAGDIKSDQIKLNGGEIIFNHTGEPVDFMSSVSGQGRVDLLSGTTVFSGKNTYSGPTSITGGHLEAVTDNALSRSSDYSVGQMGSLALNGTRQTVNSFDNAGDVLFEGNATAAVLTVEGNYSGNNGMLAFNTVLGGDESQTDRLIVKGDTAGRTRVRVSNLGGRGGKTVNGIEIISVAGKSDGDFVQDGRIVAGAFDYYLQRGEGVHYANWYLSSSLPPVDPENPGPENPGPENPGPENPGPENPGPENPGPENPGPENPEDPVPPVDKKPAIFRPEAGIYSAHAASARSLFSVSLSDRIRAESHHYPMTGESKAAALWMLTTDGHRRSQDGSEQLSNKSSGASTLIGQTYALADHLDGGVFAGVGRSSSTTSSDITGYRAGGNLSGYVAGAYATWYENHRNAAGGYADALLSYSWFNANVNGEGSAREAYGIDGMTVSLEGGYAIQMSESGRASAFLQPWASMSWSGIKMDTHRENNGTLVEDGGTKNLLLQAGLKAFVDGYVTTGEKRVLSYQPSLEISGIHNTRPVHVLMDGVAVNEAGARNIVEIKAGINGELTPVVSVHGHVAAQMGEQNWSDISARIGFSYRY